MSGYEMEKTMRKTDRGFNILDFVDANGIACNLQALRMWQTLRCT
jgi:hypothetical protein